MIEWGNIYCLGHKEIDEQHRIFFVIVEEGQRLLNKSDKNRSNQIYLLIEKLYRYTIEHFEYEEKIMKEIEYPDEVDHILEHYIFKASITDIDNTIIKEDSEKYLLRMLDFAVEWIILHIGKDDVKLVKYYNEIYNRN